MVVVFIYSVVASPSKMDGNTKIKEITEDLEVELTYFSRLLF